MTIGESGKTGDNKKKKKKNKTKNRGKGRRE